MMGVNLFLMLACSLLGGKAYSQNCAAVITGLPEHIFILENDLPDTMILHVNKSPTDNISYIISSPRSTVLQTYFKDINNGSMFILYLNKTLDLEELYSLLYPSAVSNIDLRFVCEEVKKSIIININEVNEFDPYVNITGNLNIPENTTIGTVVYNLLERTSDKDRPLSGMFYYSLVNDMFRIDGVSSGKIILDTFLDYESGQRMYLLNISVKDTSDDRARTSYVSLGINVIDVDDQGPRFDYPDCVAPCLIPEYTAITSLSFTGPLNVQPASIKAHDLDTLNFSISYSFYDETSGGSFCDDSTGFFRINHNTGTVLQMKPASEAFWPTKRLVIIAKEDGSSQSAALAILMVRVLSRDPTLNYTTVVPPESSAPAGSSNSLLTAVIIISVLMGIILIGAVIVIFLMVRRQRKMVCPDIAKSEPSTEEEEIHSERSEEIKHILPKTVSDSVNNPLTNHAFLSRPLPKKGTLLDPLKLEDNPSGKLKTRKKKRLRKLFKNSDNEIFDGTKEYNMKVDTNFYKSTDKSRIKRSARSMKTPTEHIVVPNNNVEFVN